MLDEETLRLDICEFGATSGTETPATDAIQTTLGEYPNECIDSLITHTPDSIR